MEIASVQLEILKLVIEWQYLVTEMSESRIDWLHWLDSPHTLIILFCLLTF